MEIRNLNFQCFKNLSIVQFKTEQTDTFNYISLSNALRQDMVEVKEINEAGSVNDLLVINKSKLFVFMSDGDVLKGAKQNRVLNTSVLIEPESKIIIPVSCIEAGRWRRTSESFEDEDFIAPTHLRSVKLKMVMDNLKKDNTHTSNQDEIWDEVSKYESAFKCFSHTSNLSELFYTEEKTFEDYISNFKIEDGSNGISLFNNKKLINLEIFNRCDIYNEYYVKILKSNCIELFRMESRKNDISESEAFFKTNDFLDNFENLKFERHKGIGAGDELRFENANMTGFELRYGNTMIHLTALNLKTN